MKDEEHKRLFMYSNIANSISKYYWNSTGTVVQRRGKNKLKIKYHENEELMKDLEYHLGKDTIKLIEEKILEDQFKDNKCDENNCNYWIYEIEGIDWSVVD